MRTRILIAAVLMLGACAAPRRTDLRPRAPVILERFTIPDHGAIQGAALRDGLVYIYSDRETGILTEHRFDRASRTLGAPIRRAELTRSGVDALPHPTGLALAPEGTGLPTFLGDTVRRTGLIHAIDLGRALDEGDLDRAILNTALDDRASNGCRPEYVRFDPDGASGPEPERWVVASADYGDETNTLRLFAPEMLARSTRTSTPGVLIAEFPAPVFVQTLHWIDATRTLVFVQNRTAGRGYRLTFAELDRGPGGSPPDLLSFAPLDLPDPTDELEGFVMLTDRIGLMVSAVRPGNPNATLVEFD